MCLTTYHFQAKVAVCSEINTTHKNRVWADCTILWRVCKIEKSDRYLHHIRPWVRPSVRTHGKTRFTNTRIFMQFYIWYFLKICREYSSFIKILQEHRVLYVKTNVSFWSNLSQFFLEWGLFQTICRENQNTHFMSNNFFLFFKKIVSFIR